MSINTPAIAVAVQRRKIIKAFKNARAFDEQSAINTDLHRIRRSFIFKRMQNQGIILPAGEGHYYLDIEREKQVSRKRHIVVLLISLIIAASALFYFLMFSK